MRQVLLGSIVIMLFACTSSGSKEERPLDGQQAPPSLANAPETTARSTSDTPLVASQRVLKQLEHQLESSLSPQMTVSWRVALRQGNGVRNAWLNGRELIIENGRQELWGISREPGKISFSFSLDPSGKRSDRYVIRRPCRSGEYIHVICSDGLLMTLDEHGNLEYQSSLDVEASSDPVGTDAFALFATDTRFFYAWDIVNQRYAKRSRLDKVSVARAALNQDRVYLADNDGRVHALSLGARDLFNPIWSKKSYGEVLAPLCVNPDASQLYVATRTTGVVTCYSVHNGRISWSVATECEVSQEMLVDTRYAKDRLYVITEKGDDPAKNGLWCIKTIDPAEGTQGNMMWTFPAANKILALGKAHIYVRTGSAGAYKIAVVRTSDGSKVRELAVDPRITWWFTNPHGPQIIVGSAVDGDVGLFFSLSEAE